ncbi:DUF4352 domain-containing protein [Pectinatus frisingensis]|uniref:DUF4352 domain-containing protein n=1 Tax=Pectinatus frisingensis TaxID=865 RepID=UPI0018C6178C|nr:DUF4352 domain-containing protein [Pectinatus frisingensis]
MEKKFYQRSWFVILMLIVFFPVGLYLMWKDTTWSKKAKVIISIIFALLIINAAINKDDKNQPVEQPQTVQQQTNKSENKQPAKEKKKDFEDWTVNVEGVGKIKGGISSNVGIAVIGINTTNSIGDDFSSQQAQGKFVVVKVAVSNGQNDAITVDSNSFKLIDDKNREFSASVEGMTALQMSNGNAKGFLTKVNPGIVTDVTFVFDVPKDVQGLKLKARGGFTGKAIILPLQVQKI